MGSSNSGGQMCFILGTSIGLAGNSDTSVNIGYQDMGRQDSHIFENSDVVTLPDFIDEKEEIQKN